jgi:hypothetical protein
MPSILEQAMGLSVDEKLQLIDALWKSMAREPEPDCYFKDGKIVFANAEQREKVEQKLEEAIDEIERGECTPWKRGDCARMGREYLEEKHANDPAR